MKKQSRHLLLGSLVALVMALAVAGAIQAAASRNGSLTGRPVDRRPFGRAEIIAHIRQIAPEFSADFDSGLVGCSIQRPSGQNTTIVLAAELGDGAFWLNYLSQGTSSQRVTFVVTPAFEGSPLSGQKQVFDLPAGSEFDNISTPFGIPFWGLDLTSGPWVLAVRSDSGAQAMCPFTVEPQ